MTQVKSSQIIPSRTIEVNPSVSTPRDLQLNADQIKFVTGSTAGSSLSGSTTATGTPASPGSNSIINDDISNSVIIPEVPIILAVSQQVVIGDDGKSTIDLTITLKDIPGINEFDIRVAKSAGNL